MDNVEKQSARSGRTAVIKLVCCPALALFWVLFIWGFWNKGVYALGLNAFLFFLFFLLAAVWFLHDEKSYERRDLFWIIPLALVALSFLIYGNPFIKLVSLLAFPSLSAVLINYGSLKGKDGRQWDLDFVWRIIGRIFSIFVKIGEAISLYFGVISPRDKKNKSIIGRTVLGSVLFLIISSIFIIPLLSSADPVFAERILFIYKWTNGIISEAFFNKAVVFIALSILLLAAFLAWGRAFDFAEKEESDKKLDPIISGIILAGILGLYLLFLWVQVERLWVGSLPVNFKETENLVKSGFWQLFFLSGINTLIYFLLYRKTNSLVQKILTVFTLASLFLLVSAGQRMALYDIFYGLSYEKFFASYAVIYSAILFSWLAFRLFRKERANVLKFLVFLFLWMYGLVTILPVEQIILRSNVALAKRPDTRINLYESTMLSPDVLGTVKKLKAEGVLAGGGKGNGWQDWIEEQEGRISSKKWYEKSLTDYLQ